MALSRKLYALASVLYPLTPQLGDCRRVDSAGEASTSGSSSVVPRKACGSIAANSKERTHKATRETQGHTTDESTGAHGQKEKDHAQNRIPHVDGEGAEAGSCMQ